MFRVASELDYPPPPGSSSCRTLGGDCSCWRKPSTTSAVSSRCTPSHTRHPISDGERDCVAVPHGLGALLLFSIPLTQLLWSPGGCSCAVQLPMAAWPSGTSPPCWTKAPLPWRLQWTLGCPAVSSYTATVAAPPAPHALSRVSGWVLTTVLSSFSRAGQPLPDCAGPQLWRQ